MTESYDLTKLDANTFEHLVNLLALQVLGAGHTGFGPGSDGGRDGYYEGEAPYPSEVDRWSGCWYIQSKFHKPHLSKDPQKWLLQQIKEELEEFKRPNSQRKWPDNWIVATNIDPSGTPMTGAFDQAKKLVEKAHPKLKGHFHIWGGSKILGLLALHSEVSEYYRHFLTPGHVLTAIYDQMKDSRAEVETILRFLIVTQFDEQQYTKLEQAGSDADTRPGIHRLFIDLPFRVNEYGLEGLVIEYLVRAAAKCHWIDSKQPDTEAWRFWRRYPSRSRVWFIKGGPGQGKSTIGQFFCQIQRASLILQEDGPPVTPRLRNIATEIRDTANKAGFWPSIPRIPISIELKEFAQWLGQRRNDQPQGILTYLAERVISVGVEQPVHVGTLKRMLQSRSWFVMFDGLDEVPQDVKDRVALEVMHFLDDVVVESNTDLLALCTSRPQGYSGQFSELDGPTINLINLSPDQALRCAEPVLRLNRPESEARKSLETLTSAIESSSVRELMTTPLQAHIMAVVVRDGGKPPERRWQLFTNFYQVIKRREANKNWPDKRVAKLLREDEQLLKTVHNRLGFVLQARAETSRGAQTNLDRNEFEDLVTNAVSQMMETEIDSTVAALMRATTDRLVLVSTPDDGSHVRFHIRPLQEFFAAEFLYESVSAEELRERIELIAGDSHWREVMHFLLSALIENGRRTELTVAIEVLEHLNEGDEDSHVRLLSRRLGRGALLAARLLQEGVLEQDKRIRQQFRKCLEPLTAFTEVEALRTLILVNQLNSQAWLFNFLADSLQEVQVTESVGAAIILAYILPDDSERVEEVKEFLLSSPPEYISLVLTSRMPSHRFLEREKFPTAPLKRWFLDVSLKLLLSSQWYLLGVKGVNSAIEILNRNKDDTYIIAEENGLSPRQIELLNELLSNLSLHRTDLTLKDYGIIKAEYLPHDWTTGTFEFKFVNVELLEEYSNAPGVLQLLYQVLHFTKTRHLSTLLALLNYLDEIGIELFEALPFHIQAYIPLSTQGLLDDQVKKLRSLNEGQFEILLKEQQINSFTLSRPYVSFRTVGYYNVSRWRNFVEDHPEISFYLWNDISFKRRKTDAPIEREEVTNVLIDKVLQVPALLRKITFLWGELLERATSSRKHELHKAFLIASSGQIDEIEFWGGLVRPFELDLPSDAPLLPWLIGSIIDYRSSPRSVEIDKESKRVRQSIYKFVNDVSLLEQITNNSTLTKTIRAGAVLMLLLHPNGDKDLKSRHQLLIELYDSEIGSWYLKAITGCLALLTTEKDPIARLIVSSLLDLARADYEGSQHLQWLLSLWRESSNAPTQTAGVQQKWLTGT